MQIANGKELASTTRTLASSISGGWKAGYKWMDVHTWIQRCFDDPEFKHSCDNVCSLCDDDPPDDVKAAPHIDGEVGDELMMVERSRLHFRGRSKYSFKNRYGCDPSCVSEKPLER